MTPPIVLHRLSRSHKACVLKLLMRCAAVCRRCRTNDAVVLRRKQNDNIGPRSVQTAGLVPG